MPILYANTIFGYDSLFLTKDYMIYLFRDNGENTFEYKYLWSKQIRELGGTYNTLRIYYDHKTKNAVAVLKALKADQAKVLSSVKEYDDNVLRATGNLPAVILIKAASVNTYQILYSDKLLFTKDALDEFVKRLA